MTNGINSFYFDRNTVICEDMPIDLGTDDGTFSSPSVIDAINAARWETEGGAYKNCRSSLVGYKFFTETVGAALSGSEYSVDPECIRAERGNSASLASLWGTLPEDTRIYIPVPISKDVLAGAKGYFRELTLFSPDCVFDKPAPGDINASDAPPEVIFLSLLNDPTGLAFTYSELYDWVEYARSVSAVLIFDTTLGIFCRTCEWQSEYPYSVYEIPGARECAVEVCSLAPSYRAGVPCGYCVIPSEIRFRKHSLLDEHDKRLTSRGNGERASGYLENHIPYVIQRGAAAHFSPAGQLESMRIARKYQKNASRLCAALALKGFECTRGGISPYVFGSFCPDGLYPPFPEGSGSLRDRLERTLSIRALHGELFGLTDGHRRGGKEYIRISGTTPHSVAEQARLRILGM